MPVYIKYKISLIFRHLFDTMNLTGAGSFLNCHAWEKRSGGSFGSERNRLVKIAFCQMPNAGSLHQNLEKSIQAMQFSGESVVVNANGDLLVKVDDQEQILYEDLAEAGRIRNSRPYTNLRRTEWYL